jgi:V/A-type H+-transporting ATPase subunit C
MLRSYLARWDVWNMITVMRAKSFGASWEEVAEDLVPAGAFDLAFFLSLYNCANMDEMVELIMRAQPGDDLALGKLLHGGGRPALADIENTMDREYYTALLGSVSGNTPADRLFRRYIATEIDIVNLKTIFKLKFEGVSLEKVSELLIPGGQELPHAVLTKLAATESFDTFLNELAGAKIFEGIRDAAGRVKALGSLNEVLLALDRELVRKAHQFSHLYPLSILPIIDYLLRKKIEVDNLRTIARGKQSGLPEEDIRSLLVL